MATKTIPAGLKKIKHTIYDRIKDQEISEDLLALPQKQAFSVSAAASACGLSVELFRGLVNKLAANPKLAGYLNLRVTQTVAHCGVHDEEGNLISLKRSLGDDEPYEILQKPQVERLRLTKEDVKALPYLEQPAAEE